MCTIPTFVFLQLNLSGIEISFSPLKFTKVKDLQLNLSGIEIILNGKICVLTIGLQLNLSGIEIKCKPWRHRRSSAFNWTLVELKFDTTNNQLQDVQALQLNLSGIEIVNSYNKHVLGIKAFNWTLVELKYEQWMHIFKKGYSFNWTLVELK